MATRKTEIKYSTNLFCFIGIVFVTLKLLGLTAVASWSWWYVTLPFWIGPAITATFLLMVLAFFMIAAILGHRS